LIPATSSSRYVSQNFWRDPLNGVSYQVQVEVPQKMITSQKELAGLPIQGPSGDVRPLSDYASLTQSTMIGEFDRYNMQRMISVIANLHGKSLGKAAIDIENKLKEIQGEQPKGTFVRKFGQMPALQQMIKGLGFGLLLAIIVVFLLLAANYESIAISAVTLSTTPAVIMGALLMLLATKSTLNIQSFMGMIMAIGVSVSNSILIVTFAERARLKTRSAAIGAYDGAKTRLRPVLMTSGAMLAGMLPMALGLTEGGEQMAPLGRAVLGGVLCSTIGTLIFLPLVFAWVQNKRTLQSPSLDPDDVESKHFSQDHGAPAHPI
jgi:multidrug efflux pump subunit AcrB